jgi:hypothetical protein
MAADFAKTLKMLLDYYSSRGLDYALIGGFALQAYGLSRNTDDIDFVLRSRDASGTIKFLESIGYQTLNRTEAFSNHEHPLSGFSRVDFLYVNGETADALFSNVREFPVFGNSKVRVVKPEHLIALKLFSMAANPERRALDQEDLVHLLHQEGLDRDEIRRYFQKYSTLEELEALERTGP